MRLSSVVRVTGPHAPALVAAMGEALIADSFDTASRVAAHVTVPVTTLEGDVFRGRHVVTGGDKAEARGILATKREIKDLRDKVGAERSTLAALADETTNFERVIAEATAAIQGLGSEIHRQEMAIVSVEALADRTTKDLARLESRSELVATEIRRIREEIASLDLQQDEGRESITRLETDKRGADEILVEAQQRLSGARDQAESASLSAGEARAALAALVERSAAAATEVARMESAAQELERRVEACARDFTLMREQRERLLGEVADLERQMDDGVRGLETLRGDVQAADDKAASVRAAVERQDEIIRDSRRAVDAVRALAAELDITRATAESDLGHLAQQVFDAVGITLDEVREDVARMEAAGEVEPDVRAIRAAEAPDPDEDEPAADEPADGPVREHMTAEEAIAELRARIDRIGPVNMMAIEQHTELEARHLFLTTQRQDLIDSIAQTNEAIKRIDETTHVRFREAFTAINANFQETFSTLFGGGRAGISLLDESDPLESGIDIVASPPGKRLQSVMLLSGGEKALAAIALMFAIFRYKPSPFCLLDEIDAPLDDANIGRFVELLRGMMDKTQFIIITHSRKTMEIANRLYGVTMEEPGVSKLISIQMN